jgi:CRISPR/Cas system CSM-associated protein Csm2 small subunit
MDRIALQILEDGWAEDARVMTAAEKTMRERLAEPSAGRHAAAAFKINRIYNILEKSFERLCETFENHLDRSGRYHEHLIERVCLELRGIRPAFVPRNAGRAVRELKGFRHVFRHAYDVDLDPARVEEASRNASRCVAEFPGWCEAFLRGVRTLYRDELGR